MRRPPGGWRFESYGKTSSIIDLLTLICRGASRRPSAGENGASWNIPRGCVFSPEGMNRTRSEERMAERPHNFLREGVVTGFIGATAIAVWFLIVDTISGRPFYTPIFLGRGVVSVLGKNMMGDTAFTQVLGYTIFHYAAFLD